MKTEISLDEAVGKTIEGYTFSFDQMILTLEGNAFVTIKAVHHDGYIHVVASVEPAVLSLIPEKELVRLGVMTGEEIKAAIEARVRKLAEENEAAERRLFATLKKKFEDEK